MFATGFGGVARRVAATSSAFVRSFASVGDQLPSVELHQGFPPKKYNLAEFAKDKSILLVGLVCMQQKIFKK